MRKLVYHVSTTLDNFICHEDGSIHGFLTEGDHIPDYLDSLKNYDTVVMGKATYEFGYPYGLTPGQPAYSSMRNYIFSKTLQIGGAMDSRVNIIRNDAVNFIRKLKNENGTSIYLCGGGTFAASLLDHQLIDSIIIKLNPVLIGKGIRLFENSQKQVTLSLLEIKQYGSGVLLLTYAVIKE